MLYLVGFMSYEYCYLSLIENFDVCYQFAVIVLIHANGLMQCQIHKINALKSNFPQFKDLVKLSKLVIIPYVSSA